MLRCLQPLWVSVGWHFAGGADRATHGPTSAKATFYMPLSPSHAQIADANRNSDAHSWHVTSDRFPVTRDSSTPETYTCSR